MKISPGIHQLKLPIPDNPLGFVNCYLVEGNDGWLMVDTGWPADEAISALEAELQDLGLSLSDVTTIIATHAHPDHSGLVGRIKQISPKISLLAHPREWDSIIDLHYIKFASFWKKMSTLMKQHGVSSAELATIQSVSLPTSCFVMIPFPDQPLYGGEIIDTGVYQLETIWTPGHSPGHICLYEPKNRLLFTGDHILPGITPNVSYDTQSGDNPLGDYLHSLRKLKNLEVDKVLPCHQDTFTNLYERIGQLFAHHEERKQDIWGVIFFGQRTAYDIASLIPWDLSGLVWSQFPPLQKCIAITETIAHLEYMCCEGKTTKINRNGLTLYGSNQMEAL